MGMVAHLLNDCGMVIHQLVEVSNEKDLASSAQVCRLADPNGPLIIHCHTHTHTHPARPRGQFCVGNPLPHSNSRPPHVLLVFVYSFTNLVYSVGKMKPSGNMSYLGEGGQRHFAIAMHCV